LAARFPVRIEIAGRDPEYPLRMGMTAFVTVLGQSADNAATAHKTLPTQ